MLDKLPEAKPGSLESLYDASISWRYMAPSGITLEMCQRPDFWKNVIRECAQQRVHGRPSWNRIEIISEDGTWEAELRILSASDGLVHTRVIREWNAPARPGRKASAPDGYVIEHIPSNGWRVLDPKGSLVTTNLPIEDDAIRAAAAHADKVRKPKGDG